MSPKSMPLSTIKYGFIFCVLGFLVYTMRSVGWFSDVPGDLADSRFNNVILEHLYLWVTGRAEDLWSPDFFYPFKDTLAFSDNHFGTGPLYVLFRLIGFDRITAYQIWFVVGITLNFLSSYYVLRRLGFSDLAAAGGAFAFAFALSNLPNEGHSQLTFRFAVPLALLFLWEGINLGKPLRIGVAAALTAYQFLCSIYLGVFLVYLLGLVALICFLFRPRDIRRLWEGLKKQTIADSAKLVTLLVLSLAVVGALLRTYSHIGSEYGFERADGEVIAMLPRLESYLIADRSSLWQSISANFGLGLSHRHEHQMFFGLMLIVGAVLGFLMAQKTYRHLANVMAASLLSLIFFTLYFGSYSPYVLFLQHVPGVNAIRAVVRIDLVMALPLGVLVAVFLHKLQQQRSAGGRVAALGFAGLLLVEPATYNTISTPRAQWEERQRAVDAVFPAQYSENAILYVTNQINWVGDYLYTELDGMIAAQDRDLKTINGYSGNFPPGHIQPNNCWPFESRFAAPEALKRDDAPPEDEIASRILKIELKPCEGDAVILTGPIDFAVIPNMRLEVRPRDEANSVVASVHNGNDRDLATVSPEGKSIKLSWRVVPPDTLPSEGEWSTRMELSDTLEAGTTLEIPIRLDPVMLEKLRAGGQLQVSLVQEFVTWFHDRGMQIAVYSPYNEDGSGQRVPSK